MSKQAVNAITCLAVCLLLFSSSDTSAGNNGAWYSNGYVLEASLLRAPNGKTLESEHCQWRESLKELECHSTLNGEPYTNQQSYNSVGRIIQKLTGSGSDDWATITTTAYKNDRIYQVAESGYSAKNLADVIRYNWQADSLVEKTYYYGAYPVADKSQFVPEKVNWNNDRVTSIEPSTAAEDLREHDEREVYSYKTNGQVQTIAYEDWNPQTQAWTPRLVTNFHYSAAGNITHAEHFDEEGRLELTREFTWQKTHSIVENISYTAGRL